VRKCPAKNIKIAMEGFFVKKIKKVNKESVKHCELLMRDVLKLNNAKLTYIAGMQTWILLQSMDKQRTPDNVFLCTPKEMGITSVGSPKAKMVLRTE